MPVVLVKYTLLAAARGHFRRGDVVHVPAGSDLDRQYKADPAWSEGVRVLGADPPKAAPVAPAPPPEPAPPVESLPEPAPLIPALALAVGLRAFLVAQAAAVAALSPEDRRTYDSAAAAELEGIPLLLRLAIPAVADPLPPQEADAPEDDAAPVEDAAPEEDAAGPPAEEGVAPPPPPDTSGIPALTRAALEKILASPDASSIRTIQAAMGAAGISRAGCQNKAQHIDRIARFLRPPTPESAASDLGDG